MPTNAAKLARLVAPDRELYANYGYRSAFTGRRKVFPSREEALRVKAKSAIERRILVPLDAGNWIRALEIIRSSYGRPGAEAKHYQDVIRSMADTVVGDACCDAAPHRAADIAAVFDRLREEFYETDVANARATNVGVWVTLVWAYCRLGCLTEAMEASNQMVLRYGHRLSASTKQHVGELMLPLCAARGLDGAAATIAASLVAKQTEDVGRWLLEAVSRSGRWQHALAMCSAASRPAASGAPVVAPTTTDAASPHQLDRLFMPKDTPRDGPASVQAVGSPGRSCAVPTQWDLSPVALAAMAIGAARDNRWREALALYTQYHATDSSSSSASRHAAASAMQARRTPPPLPLAQQQRLALDVARHVLNTLSFHRRWAMAVAVYQRHFQPHLPFDAPATNMLFHAFPEKCDDAARNAGAATTTSSNSSSSSVYPQFQHPRQVVALYQELVFGRDAFRMSNWVSSVVAPCLVQLGQWQRSLQVLRNAPLMLGKAAKVAGPQPAQDRSLGGLSDREAERRLVRTVYALHDPSLTSQACHIYTLWKWPFAFPKEVFRNLPARDALPGLLAARTQAEQQQDLPGVGVASAAGAPADSAGRLTVEALEAGVPLPPIHRPDPRNKNSSTWYEAEQTKAIAGNVVALARRPAAASPFTSAAAADPHADPRPAPLELHDQASGWTHFSRGGSKAFMNLRGLVHPFSMRPNYMKARYDVNRSWNPRLNSSFAHREPLKKYRKNSSI